MAKLIWVSQIKSIEISVEIFVHKIHTEVLRNSQKLTLKLNICYGKVYYLCN